MMMATRIHTSGLRLDFPMLAVILLRAQVSRNCSRRASELIDSVPSRWAFNTA